MYSARRPRYWQWQGIDAEGQRQRGLIEAADRRQARDSLHQQSIAPIIIRRFITFGTPCCSSTALTQWMRQLQQLLAADIGLPQALQVMAQMASSPATQLLTHQVHHTLAQGESLASALKATSHAHMPPIELTLLATAEQESVLDHGLRQLVERRQRQHDWQQRCRQQMRYPLTLIVAGLGTLTLMMKMVVPRFAQLYQQSGHALPLLTRGLITLTHALTSSAWPYAVLVALAVVSWRSRHHPYIARISAHLPVIATLQRYRLGIALLEQLLLMRQTRRQPPLLAMPASQQPLDVLTHHLQHALAAGASLSHVLSSCRSGSRPLFAKDVIHLLRIAEHTGQMDDVLEQASQLIAQRSEHYRQTLTAWLEPILLSCLGLVIGTLMLSLYLPILDMKDVMI